MLMTLNFSLRDREVTIDLQPATSLLSTLMCGFPSFQNLTDHQRKSSVDQSTPGLKMDAKDRPIVCAYNITRL